MNAKLEKEAPEIWHDRWLLGLYVNPLAHRLLLVNEDTCTSNPNESHLIVLCKLSGILYLGRIRREFMQYQFIGPHFEQRLFEYLSSTVVDWGGFEEMELWVLMTFAINSTSSRRKVYLIRIVQLMIRLGVKTWEQLIVGLSEILWLNSVVVEEGNLLKKELEESVKDLGVV